MSRLLFEWAGIQLPQNHNTRRNRRRALIKYLNQIDHACSTGPVAECAPENEARCAAHLADYIDQGGNIKSYSAWSGVGIRHLSKILFNYRHQRLEAQRRLQTPESTTP